MITRFRVQNYKCLRDVDIPLTPIHVLIGQNASGKTSLLEAMYGLFRTLESGVKLAAAFPESSLEKELLYHRATEPVVRFDVDFAPKNQPSDSRSRFSYSLLVEIRPSGISAAIKDELIDGRSIRESVLNVTPFDAAVLSHFRVPRPDIQAAPTLWQYAQLMPRAKSFRFNPKLMAFPSAIRIDRKFDLDPDGFGLPTLLAEIQDDDQERFSQLQRDFRNYFPQFSRIKFSNIQGYSRVADQLNINLNFSSAIGKEVRLVTSSGKDVRLQQASDGAILLLGFLALIHSPSPPGLILIEEPENGIYPKRLSEVVSLLRRFVINHPNAPQIVLTTHSPYLMSDFNPEEITFMCPQPDGSVRARPLRDSPLVRERLGEDFDYLGELWYNYDEEVIFGEAQPEPSHH